MSRENPTTSPLVAAATAIAIAEGASAARGSIEMGAVPALTAFAEVAGIVAAPAIGAALVLAAFARRKEVRGLGHAVITAVAGEDPSDHGWAVAIEFGVLGVLATWASILSRHVVEKTSPQVASLVSVAAGAGALAASLVVTAAIARPLLRVASRLAVRVPARGRAVARSVAPAIALGIVLLAMNQLLPEAYFLPVALGLVTFAVVRIALVRRRLAAVARGARGLGVVSLLLAASAVSLGLLPHASADTKIAVLYRAPLASTFLTMSRALVDSDGDGYSPILLGGDCNDSDPSIHPGAYDVPGDGIDQNCTGDDARVFAPAPPPPPDPEPTVPTNIVVVHLDALRPDHLGMEGYPRPTSPILDRFAKTATAFRDAYTPAPGTRFAMASIFTGLEVERVPSHAGPGFDYTLREDAKTVAEALRDEGYDTVGFTLSEVAQHVHGIGQGFRVWKTPWQEDHPDYTLTAERTTDAAIDYLAGATRPFYLFAHYMCTHDPYVKHKEHDFGNRPMDVYDSAAAHCDRELGRLLDAVDARPDADRTAVIVYSDHGELFGEHGFYFHGTTLYQPDARVVLLARVPGGRAGAEVTAPVTLTDIGPTILALAGAPPIAKTSAWSLLPYARGEDVPPPRPVFLYAEVYAGPVHFEANGVIDGPCKLVRYFPSGAEQLFDFRADPFERHAGGSCGGETAAHYRELLDAWSTYVNPLSEGGDAHVVGLE